MRELGGDVSIGLKELRVTAFPDACGPHSLQLYAGLTDLARRGEILLTYRRKPTGTERTFHSASLWLSVEDLWRSRSVKVCFDLYDGGEIASPDGLEKCDVYFKRSYSADVVRSQPVEGQHKIKPMGLNYPVLGDNDGDVPKRLRLESAIRELLDRPFSPDEKKLRYELLLSAFSQAWWPGSVLRLLIPKERTYESPPEESLSGRVLFQTRVYPPETTPRASGIEALNERRASLVRALRHSFGRRFIGGIVPSTYARSRFPDCLTHPPCDQYSYLQLVKQAQIGIVSEGIHRSIPWKCVEYLAASRCIVSDPLAYQLPQPLVPDQHLLEYTDLGSCIAACDELLSRPKLAQGMQAANRDYYLSWVKPRSLVRDCLARALHGAA